MTAERCPGVLALHEAADGLLARVRLPGGRISPAGLEAVADVAATAGDVIECTARASLQIRGLDGRGAAPAAARLEQAGLMPSPSHERVRNILASPLAGRHPSSRVAVDAVVAALDAGLCADPALAGLPGRFLFAVHDGSSTLDDARADLTLAPADGGREVQLGLTVGRLVTDLTASAEASAAVALAAARAFLGLSGGPGEPARGVRSLPREGTELVAALGGHVLEPAVRPGRGLEPGVLRQADGRRAVTATVPLGRLDAAAARSLAALARRLGTDVRISTQRSLTLPDVAAATAGEVSAALAAIGLVLAPSGWHGLTACAGLGACSRATVDVRAIAAARAVQRRPGDPPEHHAACPRGCGRPAGVALAGSSVPA